MRKLGSSTALHILAHFGMFAIKRGARLFTLTNEFGFFSCSRNTSRLDVFSSHADKNVIVVAVDSYRRFEF